MSGLAFSQSAAASSGSSPSSRILPMISFSSGRVNSRFGRSLPTFGHSVDIALAGVGVDRGAAEVRPEDLVAAGQVGHLDVRVHRVRLPAEEDDPLAALLRPPRLGQHRLLRALLQLELAEAELVALDHVEDQPVAVVARLDAVDRPVELVAELGDVGEVLQPRVRQAVVDRERVLRALEVRRAPPRPCRRRGAARGRPPSSASSCRGRRRCRPWRARRRSPAPRGC